MQEYLLLYNLFGYPSKGPKQALLRRVCEKPGVLPTHWRLYHLTQGIEEVASGAMKQEKQTYGIDTWSCDFSDITFPDLYTLYVFFSNGQSLSSKPFEIAKTPYLNHLSLRVSIENAKVRFARGTTDGGFYDCNSRMGEAYSHGVFLNGLCWFDLLHSRYLTSSEKAELRWAEQTAFDYLMRLYDENTGEYRNFSPEKPFDPRNFGLFNTIDALYGLSAYVSLIGSQDPQRANAAVLERLEKSFAFIQCHEEKPEALIHYINQEWLPVIACHLYHFSQKKEYLLLAKETLLPLLPQIDLRDMPRGYWGSISLFEGMGLLAAFLPEVTKDPAWMVCLDRAQVRLTELLQRNAYRLPPPVDPAHSAPAWDHMEEMPCGTSDNSWSTQWFNNNDVLLWGIQACYLSLLTNNHDFDRSAAAALDFVCGLNFGLPGNMVNPPSEEKLAAASFFVNAQPCIKDWRNWYWRPNSAQYHWASLVNGYTVRDGEAFYTDEDFITGETFIKHDGLFLYLASFYECILNDELPAFFR